MPASQKLLPPRFRDAPVLAALKAVDPRRGHSGALLSRQAEHLVQQVVRANLPDAPAMHSAPCADA